MASARRPLVAGNWKMNGLQRSVAELAKIIAAGGELAARLDIAVCPPATLIADFAARARGSKIMIGAQDCHAEPSGAFTGDISAEMLKDAGASAVIVGHSERRTHHHETDAEVRAKAGAAWRAGLTAIVCIGETRTEREAGHTIAVAGTQLEGSLPDGETGVGPDFREARLDLPHHVPMPGPPQLFDGGPPLAPPSDVLPLVLADGAPGGRVI